MLKVLILFPLMLIGGALALGVVLPLLVLLPAVFAVGIGIVAIVMVFSILGFILRLAAGLLLGAGGLLIAGLGFGLFFAGGALLLVLGFALAHLLVPMLLIAFIIWIIRRSARPTPAPALPAPQT